MMRRVAAAITVLGVGVCASPAYAATQTPSWVPLTVAAIALLGVIFTGAISWTISQERMKFEKAVANAANRAKLNEEYWRLMDEKLRHLIRLILATLRSFKGLARDADQVDQDRYFNSLYVPLKNHVELGDLLLEIEGEIRDEDYDLFRDIHKYCMSMFLDLDMSAASRAARKQNYEAHYKKLQEMEARVLNLKEAFLRARGVGLRGARAAP